MSDDPGKASQPAPAMAEVDEQIRSGLSRLMPTAPNSEGLQRSLYTTASSVGAVLLAFAICGLLLAVTGKNPFTVYGKIIDLGLQKARLLEMVDRATPLMLAAVAVAIGFKMNLFNIGVGGQLQMGMMFSAVAGAYVTMPAVFHVAFIMIVAMAAGAVWASIPALLKVSRNVNEVIATIMLNFIATGITAWLFDEYFKQGGGDSLNVKTKLLPTTAWMPEVTKGLTAFVFIAVAFVGLYWVLVFKTRFGFHLRSSGQNAGAATTAGIGAKRMVFTAMLLSGAVAGLVALPALLGEQHAYIQANTPVELGFAGIAVALLGRLHPVGIIAGALLYGFLDMTSSPLQIAKIPSSIVEVMQAIILLTVVIVNEATARWLNERTATKAARHLQVAGAVA